MCLLCGLKAHLNFRSLINRKFSELRKKNSVMSMFCSFFVVFTKFFSKKNFRRGQMSQNLWHAVGSQLLFASSFVSTGFTTACCFGWNTSEARHHNLRPLLSWICNLDLLTHSPGKYRKEFCWVFTLSLVLYQVSHNYVTAKNWLRNHFSGRKTLFLGKTCVRNPRNSKHIKSGAYQLTKNCFRWFFFFRLPEELKHLWKKHDFWRNFLETALFFQIHQLPKKGE